MRIKTKLNIFLILLIIFFISPGAYALSVTAVAQNNFSTLRPGKSFAVKLTKPVKIDSKRSFPAGTVIFGKTTKVQNAQRGKRRATFEFMPTHYTTSKGTKELYNKNIIVRVQYYKKPDKTQTAKSIATSGAGIVANNYIPFVSQGYAFTKGAITKNQDKNRLKSGAINVYKTSPLTYIEKGNELNVRRGQTVKLIFYTDK